MPFSPPSIQRMLTRRSIAPYTSQQTIQHLSWLALQMQKHSQTEFYLERLQPDWLPDSKALRRYQRRIIWCIYSLYGVLTTALFAWIRGGEVKGGTGVGVGLLGQLGGGPGNQILGWMSPGVGGGIQGGGSLGILIALIWPLLLLILSAPSFPTVSWQACWYALRRGLTSGLKASAAIGLPCLLIFTLVGGVQHGLVYGIGAGLLGGLHTGLGSGMMAGIRSHSQMTRSNRTFRERLIDGLIMGLLTGTSFGIVDALLHVGIQLIVAYAAVIGIFLCIGFGLAGGQDLIPDLETQIKPAEMVSWSWQNIGRFLTESLAQGLLVGLLIMICVSLVIGIASSLFYGVGYGVKYGVIYGLIIGLLTVTAILLTGMAKSGWSVDVLDTRELIHPNEGIRRSLKNAFFAASLFGTIGGILSGVVCAVAFGLVGGLHGWLVLGLGFTILLGMIFGLQFLTIHGGIAWTQHYLLRWSLSRAGSLLWNAIAFLEYATDRILLRRVGGGYMFLHRLLLEHLAAQAEAEEKAKEQKTHPFSPVS